MVWTPIANLTGKQGLRGIQGAQGPAGAASVPAIAAVKSYFETENEASAAGDKRWARARDIVAVGPGIDPTGASDSSDAVQVLLRKAQAEGGALVFPAGTFALSGVKGIPDIRQPRIMGAGGQKTFFIGSTTEPILTFTGGSGHTSEGGVYDIAMHNEDGFCIELQGVCDFKIERVAFEYSYGGVLFHNKDAGAFTEFCVIESCSIEGSVTKAIEYRRTNGHESFHGSGFRGTRIGQDASTTTSAIEIGAGCVVYNAPFDGTFFGSAPYVSLIGSLSNRPAVVFGHLNFETHVFQNIVHEASVSPVYFAGTISRLSNGTHRGNKLILVTDIAYNVDGSLSALRLPIQTTWGVGGATNPLMTIEHASMVDITITATGYLWNGLVYAFASPTGGGTASVMATGIYTDTRGWAPPTFSYANGRLVLSSPFFAGSVVDAVVTETPVQGRFQIPVT